MMEEVSKNFMALLNSDGDMPGHYLYVSIMQADRSFSPFLNIWDANVRLINVRYTEFLKGNRGEAQRDWALHFR